MRKLVNVVASDQAKRLSSQPINVKSTIKVAKKTMMSLPCITCLSISISGRLAATVLIQKANVVPKGSPFVSKLSMIGTMPVTLV